MEEFRKNEEWLIETPNGFEPFSGIRKLEKPNHWHIIFADGTEIKCSVDHRFRNSDNQFVEANQIKAGQILTEKEVSYSEFVNEPIVLFDAIEVGAGHSYYTNGVESHNCEFIGSSGHMLVSSSKLKMLSSSDPIEGKAGELEVFVKPEPGHVYCLLADTAQGVGLDFSAFSVIDISQMPYIQVAAYKNNKIQQLEYPLELYKAGKYYNDAYALIEINDGRQVADILYSEYEYESQLFSYRRTANNAQRITTEYIRGANPGIQMTAKLKKQAAGNLKTLIEANHLILNDYDTIQELNHFIQIKNSWAAEATYHDDLVMGLCLFAWLALQPFFKELADQNIRDKIRSEKEKMYTKMVDAPQKQDGLFDGEYEISDGVVWHNAASGIEHPVERAWREMGNPLNRNKIN